jgi:cardiolipin synthase
VTIPNLITIARLFLVPLTVWLIIYEKHELAFWTFVAAGASDAVDGFLARTFNMWSDLGSYLDPIADKALLVSLFIVAALYGYLPPWLTILVVSRDILIIGAVVLAWMLGQPVAIRPRMVSKVNTFSQIALIALVLANNAFNFASVEIRELVIIATAALTVASAAVYVVDWVRHMGGDIAAGGPAPNRSGPKE